jgi:exodeoxyribonuclease VII small subunit
MPKDRARAEGAHSSESPDAPASTDAAPSFEAASRRLSDIVLELERGDLPLEQALALFEEGIKLARTAHATIERAERRVEELLGFDGDGRAVTRGLEP